MCRTQSMTWGAMLPLTITSACTNRWTIKRQQASTGTAKPWRQRPPSIDRRVVLTLGSTLTSSKEHVSKAVEDLTILNVLSSRQVSERYNGSYVVNCSP